MPIALEPNAALQFDAEVVPPTTGTESAQLHLIYTTPTASYSRHVLIEMDSAGNVAVKDVP
jgi:hypothetical protein